MIAKRLFDVVLALGVLLILWPVMLVVCLLILFKDGRPIFFLSERMKTPQTSFNLIKFRTMTHEIGPGGIRPLGGDQVHRVTRVGKTLRRTRLDELPQLINVLKGDISLVGPRPPLRRYVEDFPKTYEKVLRAKPGITGLATVLFHRHEEWLLSHGVTPEETESLYRSRCVPRKADLDIWYQDRQSICLDLYLMYLTAAKLGPVPGRRAARLRRR